MTAEVLFFDVFFEKDPHLNAVESFTLLSFYLALVTKKYSSIEKRICFKKDLLVARDQLPNNIPVTYFLYSFL